MTFSTVTSYQNIQGTEITPTLWRLRKRTFLCKSQDAGPLLVSYHIDTGGWNYNYKKKNPGSMLTFRGSPGLSVKPTVDRMTI